MLADAVCPGLFDTPMSDRMKAAGQTEALQAMLADVPIGRVGPTRRDRVDRALFAVQRRA